MLPSQSACCRDYGSEGQKLLRVFEQPRAERWAFVQWIAVKEI